MRHELKTDPKPFEAVWQGTKLYEIRRDDRTMPNKVDASVIVATPYTVGDELLLRETRFSGEQMKGGRNLEYTDREVLCEVTHKLAGPMYGLEVGWCILGIKRLELRGRMYMDHASAKADQPAEPKTVVEGHKTRDPMPVTEKAKGAFSILHSLGYEWVNDVWAIDSLRLQAITKMVAAWPFSPRNSVDMNLAKSALKPPIEVNAGQCYNIGPDDVGRIVKAVMNPWDGAVAKCPPVNAPVLKGEFIDAKQMSNTSGHHVSYYSVDIEKPSKGGAPYRAEAIDCISALDMTFAEGEAFKAIWRCAADRIGAHKDGNDTRRDAEKVMYYGEQMLAREKRRHG